LELQEEKEGPQAETTLHFQSNLCNKSLFENMMAFRNNRRKNEYYLLLHHPITQNLVKYRGYQTKITLFAQTNANTLTIHRYHKSQRLS